MSSFCRLLIGFCLCCLLAGRAQAQEIEQGQGVFCDTQTQLEQFAAYYESGSVPEALEQVNLTVPYSCKPARAAFIRGEQVKAIAAKRGTLRLYEVLIVALWNGQWGKVKPTLQYIAIFDKEKRA
jgi:hypothetical protein